MKKNIVICTNPFISHLVPTLVLADYLKEQGHVVSYLGFSETNVESVNIEYVYYELNTCDYKQIDTLKREQNYITLEKVYKSLHKEIEIYLKKLNADIVLFHISRTPIFLIPVINVNAKPILYNTCCGAQSINCYVPPSTSSFIPKSGYVSKFICMIMWYRRYIRKIRELFLAYKYYPFKEFRKIKKHYNVKIKYGIDGYFLDFPEIILAPYEIEFLTNKYYENKKNIYLGLCIRNTLEKSNKKEFLYGVDKSKLVIYCTFGTMNYRYKKYDIFINGIIEIMKKYQNIQLIVSLGGNKNSYNNLPDNVYVYEYVDQIEVLRYCDMAIIHGGLSTIKECIYREVPMLVLPCSYDQHGNAARVVYHNIGKRNFSMKRCFKERLFKNYSKKIDFLKIEDDIFEVLYNFKYKNSIKKLNEKIVKEKQIRNIDSYLM